MSPIRHRWLVHLATSAKAVGRADVKLLGQRRFAMRQVVVDTDPLITGYATLEVPPACAPPGLDVALVPVRTLLRALQDAQ